MSNLSSEDRKLIVDFFTYLKTKFFMEESKFLEAQNLKSQIHYLEKCLDSLQNEKNAQIGITWPKIETEMNYVSSTCWEPITKVSNNVKVFPTKIQEQIKELIQNELDKLKQKFKLL